VLTVEVGCVPSRGGVSSSVGSGVGSAVCSLLRLGGGSVSNGSKFAVWFRVQVGAELEAWQPGVPPSKIRTAPNPWFFGRFHKLIISELWLQLSI
jgi:hypothetical protein